MTRRSERISEAIRREISIMIREELKDPRIGFVTVTRVSISEDLRSAVIYYSIYGDEKTKKLASRGLASALRFMRKEIGKRLELRYTPELRLKIDDRFEYVEKMDKVFKKIEDERKEKDVNKKDN